MMGQKLIQLLTDNVLVQSKTDVPNDNWVNLTCNAIGSKDADAGPPAEAVAAVKALLIETTRMLPADKSLVPKTHLVEVWGVAALDPDDQIFLWLRDGAPAGITTELIDPGIFPKCNGPADLQPGDLHRKRNSAIIPASRRMRLPRKNWRHT